MIKYTQIPTQDLTEKTQVLHHLKNFGISENHLTLLRKAKENILINNVPSIVRDVVSSSDILLINASPGKKTEIKAIDQKLDIVFEDEHVLVVNKPSGLSSMPNRSHYDNNLAGQIVAHCQNNDPHFVLRIVNRLDKDTQGLVLVAKTLVVYKALLETSKKKYHALLSGKIENKKEIHTPISEVIADERIQLKRVASPNGKPASTFIKPIKNFANHTLCEVEIVFGRTHQIRVHTQSIGHGIEGDYVYNMPSELIDHTALVCKEISFYHPILKKNLFFEVDYENSFKKLLESV